MAKLFSNFFTGKSKSKKSNKQAIKRDIVQMMSSTNNRYYQWGRKLYESDHVRASIRPKVRMIAKSQVKHMAVDKAGKTVLFPKEHIRLLLQRPNPRMTMQQLLERMLTQLELNNNAFAFIYRHPVTDLPMGIYPLNVDTAEVVEVEGVLHYRFTSKGKSFNPVKFEDIIHLMKDSYSNDYFGDSNVDALGELMEVVHTLDAGLVNAIKNSSLIRWIFRTPSVVLEEDDLTEFVKTYSEQMGDADSDILAVDGKVNEIIQVTPHDIVPEQKNTEDIRKRIMAYFNTNERIVNSTATEEELNAYFELNVEPDLLQLGQVFTLRLFTAKEQAAGHRIVFESVDMAYASFKTKLQLVAMFDRGILSQNEIRKFMNIEMREDEMADKYIIRKEYTDNENLKDENYGT